MDNKDLSYFFLAGPSELVNQAVIYGEWKVENQGDSQLKNLKPGDIILFYSFPPIDGIVGFGTIKNRSKISDSIENVEFSRNYCLPTFLWKHEKIALGGPNGINQGIFQLNNKEEIVKISNILNSKWGTELKNNNYNEEIDRPFFIKNNCVECGKELHSRIARYCLECREKVRKRQSVEWNKANIEKIREANKRWRMNHPEKLKEYKRRWKDKNKEKLKEQRKRWKELNPEKSKAYLRKWKTKNKISKYLSKLKQPDLFIKTGMSDWSKKLRNRRSHLAWVVRNKQRIKKINEVENKFHCCWEDKFKEVYERYKHEEAAKILNLDYHTLFIWAKHLKLQRLCIYCNKKLATAEGIFHPECKIKYESNQQSPGIKELFSLTDPALNIDALNLKDENIRQVIEDVLSTFPRKESLIIENRYLFLNRKQTLEELGKILRVTRERVRQIEQGAIKRLSHPTRQKIIREKLSKLIFKGTTVADSSLTGEIDKLQIELNQLKQKLTGGSPQEISNLPMTEVELSVRANNCLRDANIKTIGELVNKTESELLSFKNLGEKTLWELREILHSFGLKFNSEVALSVYQKGKDKPVEIKEKCLFTGCNVTPHEGKYCSKHKMQQRKFEMKEKCLHFGCNIVPRKGRYCSIHKPHKKKIRIKKGCSFPDCKISPRKGEYCSKHKTSWRRKRALELLKNKKRCIRDCTRDYK
ncbi:MAG: hypothetical protein ISS45_12780 [Candidatus Omnitrophica bacterium]|nr:hypothetical protein [Candidatus Omnitrophota bacterium]